MGLVHSSLLKKLTGFVYLDMFQIYLMPILKETMPEGTIFLKDGVPCNFHNEATSNLNANLDWSWKCYSMACTITRSYTTRLQCMGFCERPGLSSATSEIHSGIEITNHHCTWFD
ncbi:hypothetical protein AVEN_273589-1 [Araneus ventricosus]|uniref:Uncharacterized protein n=1 Tax=Araneus ventricosus TaxID=182803 RepID=A0A4Y2M769_ARAVE|nr:hypothetical protein AVEN_273589-1 [Araneus ventricosus]